MKKLLIWGAGDQGWVTLDCALATGAYGAIGFLSLRDRGCREFPGYPVHQEGEVELAPFLASYDEAIVATGDNGLREEKASVLASLGIPLATIVHPTAVISPFSKVGEGCAVLPRAVVHTNASVGRCCIINTGAIVEHDCVVGDYVNISPNAVMAGHAVVGERAFLGIGCTIRDGTAVGAQAVVGAGAVVIRDVPRGATVAGVPAKAIK